MPGPEFWLVSLRLVFQKWLALIIPVPVVCFVKKMQAFQNLSDYCSMSHSHRSTTLEWHLPEFHITCFHLFWAWKVGATNSLSRIHNTSIFTSPIPCQWDGKLHPISQLIMAHFNHSHESMGTQNSGVESWGGGGHLSEQGHSFRKRRYNVVRDVMHTCIICTYVYNRWQLSAVSAENAVGTHGMESYLLLGNTLAQSRGSTSYRQSRFFHVGLVL